MKKIVLSLIVIVSLIGNLFGISDSAGTAGMEFLKIGGDAKGAGCGGAFIADVSGIEGLYWNPAGLNGINGREALVTYNRWIGDMNYMYGAFGMPLLLKVLGKLGVSVIYMDEGSIDLTGIEGFSSDKVYDMAISAGYGFSLGKIRLGGALRYIHKSILGESSSGAAIDAGVQFLVNENLTVGGVLKNIGFASAIGDKPDGLPMLLSVAGVYKYVELKQKWTGKGFLNITVPIDNMPDITLGGEFEFKKLVSARIGYTIETGGNELGGAKGLSLGVGGKFKMIEANISWVPFADLGNSVMSSVKVSF